MIIFDRNTDSRSFLAIVLMALLVGCTPVKKWAGVASVKFVDGLPCFSIEDNELTRRGFSEVC